MKKFFKILMVLALLSGAALSCTKDYSKEIADVQKQNQDLQALVASLQNALNSTNATVSQLNSTSDKQAADIAKIVSDINAQKGDISALMADVETIEALSEVFAQLGVDLSEEIEDQALLIAALQAQAKELEEGIETVDGKATANAAAIAKIDETLKGIASTLDLLEEGMTAIEANKTAIAANKTAIEAAQKDIEAIKEQIKSLSARLTNIVAAPAKDVELQGVEFGDLKRSVINMNFVVAPASAAEAIEAGFGEGVDVKLALTNGIVRSSDTLNVTVIPDKVTAGEKGAINVYAVIDTILNVTDANEKIFASLVVSGKDEAGEFERISEPVAVITGDTQTILASSFKWYKGDEAVPTVDSFNLYDEKFDHTVDSVAADGSTLYYIAADKDWKTLPCTESDILKDYVLKTKIGDTALSIYEVADLFEIDEEEVKPHFIPKNKTTIDYEFRNTVGEWGRNIPSTVEIAKKAITITPDSTSTKFDVKLELPEENRENAVGSYRYVMTTPIAFGELSTYARVRFAQRIGKHVDEEKAAEPLTLEFGVEVDVNGDGYGDANFGRKQYDNVKWLSTTQIGTYWEKWKDATVFNQKDGKVVPNAYATVYSPFENPKSATIVVLIPYAKEQQDLRLVLQNDAQKNESGVVVLEHGDYIDLTVEPYHAAVEKTAKAVKDLFVSRKTHTAKFSTDLTVNGVLGDYKDWLKDDADIDANDSLIVYKWYKNKALNGQFITGANTVKAKQGDVEVGTAKLSLGAKDTICVEFKANEKFEEGKDVTVSVKDTIDGVIAFKYDFTFGTKKPGVKVVALDGFVKDGVITVEGKLVGGSYEINDINLANYFKVEGLKEKSDEGDVIVVKFGDTEGLEYPADSIAAVSDEGILTGDPKIKWGTLKATEFQLKAQALLEGATVGEAVNVTVKTADPILAIADVKIDSTLHGKAATFELLENLEIYSILDDETNIYPSGLTPYDGAVAVNKADMSDWTCTVNGVPYQGADLFTFDAANNQLIYNEHDAVGQVVITIPYKFTYKFGEKTFKVILTIN